MLAGFFSDVMQYETTRSARPGYEASSQVQKTKTRLLEVLLDLAILRCEQRGAKEGPEPCGALQ